MSDKISVLLIAYWIGQLFGRKEQVSNKYWTTLSKGGMRGLMGEEAGTEWREQGSGVSV